MTSSPYHIKSIYLNPTLQLVPHENYIESIQKLNDPAHENKIEELYPLAKFIKEHNAVLKAQPAEENKVTSFTLEFQKITLSQYYGLGRLSGHKDENLPLQFLHMIHAVGEPTDVYFKEGGACQPS